MSLEPLRWALTPKGVLGMSLKRELGFTTHADKAKIDRAVDRALSDLADYMDKNKSPHAFTALVRDENGVRLISVQRAE